MRPRGQGGVSAGGHRVTAGRSPRGTEGWTVGTSAVWVTRGSQVPEIADSFAEE